MNTLNSKLYNLRRLQTQSNVQTEAVDEFLFADDMAIDAPTEEKSEDLNEVWFWGSVSGDFVEKTLLKEAEGTFVVFRPNDKQEELTLAVRANDGVIFKTIYHRDSLFGFTEPLSFEDLGSALDAYNNSPVEPVRLTNTLKRPENVSLVETEEFDVLDEFNNITELLQYLRKNSKVLREKADEQEQLKTKMKVIDREIEGKLTTVVGLRKMCSIMEHQKKLLSNTQQRSSLNPSRNEEFERNREIIEAHLKELDSRVETAQDDVESIRNEYSQLSDEHNRCLAEISELQSVQEKCKSRMEGQPQLLDFVEGLLLNDYDTDIIHLDKTTWYKECSNKEVDKLLLDKKNLDGTFLVRPHKPRAGIPFCVCIVWTTQSDKRYKNHEVFEQKVEKFNVVSNGNHYGFDSSTCIFESLEELIVAYSRIPFKVHDLKYGNLTLTYPVFMDQISVHQRS